MTAPSNTPPPQYAPAEDDFRTPVPESSPPPKTDRLHRLWRGRTEDPAWARPALFALLAAAALLYLWGLSASGYANSFYSAAVQAGSESWKAFFFGSLDSSNAITVDKPPASLWPMEVSVRLFGLGSWQILVPEALMGVASVGLLYTTVKRRFGAAAGLLAGGILMVTPVAAMMFRFNNPDAMLELLMVAAIYFVLRALEDGRTKWLLWAGAVFGLAFLTKTLQAEGITYEKFRNQVRDNFIEQALRGKNVSAEIMISPHKIERYYQSHQDQFKLEDQIKLRMIVLNTWSFNLVLTVVEPSPSNQPPPGVGWTI